MNLEQLFSLDDILPLNEERNTFRNKGAHPESIKQESNLHIVGRVADGLLFTWDGKKEKSGKEVTFFCLYNLTTKKPSVLFDYDRKVDVVTASVNEQKTLLAFTVIEFKSFLENPDEETVGVYMSFIAEICPKNRVFSLSTERPLYQRVEFLYGKHPLNTGSARKENHMLFFQHSETIDLYHFPMARIDDGMIIGGQPKLENLVKGFVWAQLDQVNKRLYYAYPIMESTNDFEKKETESKLIFSVIQFCEKSPRVIAVKIPCPFPINLQRNGTSARFQYDRKALTNIVAESNVNMQVVTASNGSFFLCYQHSPTQQRTLSQESLLLSEETDESVESETEQRCLEYSVFMFHHGSILKCKIPNVIPENLIDTTRLSFTILNDCIAVILPGYIFHLLDCDAEHPPCHHLILEVPECLKLQPCGSQLSEFVCLTSGDEANINRAELLVFEPSLCKMLKLKFDNKFWTDCFLSTRRDNTRLALLHFCVLHIRDPEVVSEIFSHLVGDPANLECLNILKEYLVGSTYFHMKFQVDSSVYKLLPFSNTEPFRGHLEKDKTGKKIARISYSSVKTNDIFPQNFKDEKRKEMEFWISLKRNISHANSVERFSLKRVAMSEDGQSIYTPTTGDSGFTSIFRMLRRDTFGTVNNEFVYECVPEFLENVRYDPASKINEERDSSKVLESLTCYLHRYLPSDVPKLKIQNMAIEYTKCQKIQSSNLLQLFWEGLKYTQDTHPYQIPLNMRGSSRDCALFMLLERYHVVVKELRFPFPKGFQTFFASIGFRCLEQKLFMQYVTNGIFELENEFMSRLLEDVGDDEAYTHVISRVISGFEQPKAMKFLRKWNSPHNTSLLCQRYVSQLLTEGSVPLHNDSRDFFSQSQRFDEYERTVSSLLNSTDDSLELQTVPFRPLVNVLTALEAAALPAKKTRSVKGTGDGQESSSNSTLKFIARHAMQHTASEIDDSLGLVTF